MQGPKIDKVIFWVALIVILCFSVPLIMFPAEGKAVLNKALGWTTKTLGWAYLWFTIAAFGILLYYALGKFGNVRFGGPDARPEFSLAELGGDAVLRRHRRERHVLGHHRVGLLLLGSPVRPGAEVEGGHGVGRDVRPVPLGLHRLGGVLHPHPASSLTCTGTASVRSCACRAALRRRHRRPARERDSRARSSTCCSCSA